MSQTARRPLAAVSVLLFLLLGAGALAATSPVVPRGGKVAGKGYAYWQEVRWQRVFSSMPPGPKPCETVAVGGENVALLEVEPTGPKTRYTCNEPAGRPIYLTGASAECSTFKGDHLKFGTSPPQLERCARVEYRDAKFHTNASLDGQAIADYNGLVVGTGTYPVTLPKKNLLGSKVLHGVSAANGAGLLLQGLTAGTHMFKRTTTSSQGSVEITVTLHVT